MVPNCNITTQTPHQWTIPSCSLQVWEKNIDSTLCFPDCNIFFSCSHRTELTSFLEGRLLSCHLPRSSEVMAARATLLVSKDYHTDSTYLRKIHKVTYIHHESYLIFSHISPQLRKSFDYKAIVIQSYPWELLCMISWNKVHKLDEKKMRLESSYLNTNHHLRKKWMKNWTS